MTPAELFTRCCQALCGSGPRWKEQAADMLRAKVNSIDNMSKGSSRIPPGIWYDLIFAIRHQQARQRELEPLSVAVADVARLRPLQANTDGTHIIKNGGDVVFRGPLPAARAWLDQKQAEALHDAIERLATSGGAWKAEAPSGLAETQPIRFIGGPAPAGELFLLESRGTQTTCQMVGPESSTRLLFKVGNDLWFAARGDDDDARDPERERWTIGGTTFG